MNLFQHQLFLAPFLSTPDLAAADGRVRMTGGVRVAGGEGQRMFTAALSISDQDSTGMERQ